MTRIEKLNGPYVRDFWRRMCQAYKTKAVPKSNSKLMKAVSLFLALCRIQKRKTFMSRFYTTIGNKIYCPKKLGSGNHAELVTQICVCVHEHTHVLQERKDKWRYKFRYMRSTAKRAVYEAEGYRASMEMHHWLTGRIIPIDQVMNSLKSYGLKKRDFQTVEKYLKSSMRTIDAGGIISPTVKKAISIIEHKERIG